MQSRENFFSRRGVAANLDISNKCSLQCSLCQRQTSYLDEGKTVPGHDMPLSEFKIISDHFKEIAFCGQYSDPIHHPQFIDFLKICCEKDIETYVHVASTARSKSWFIEAFNANPKAFWIFGIDGLPNQSHVYRINQDGEKLFDIMLESRNHLEKKPCWQYIIFKYNENHIHEAKKMAKDNEIYFMLTNTVRADEENELYSDLRGS